MTAEFDEMWEDVLSELDEDTEDDHRVHHDPDAVQDAHIAQTVADRALHGRYCWASGLGWLGYHSGCWVPVSEANLSEKVRLDLISQQAREARARAKPERLKQLSSLLSASRIRAIATLARGILEVDATDFDQHPNLLNVGNGVVDLTTGHLQGHDPALLLTKTTAVPYIAGSTSSDWDTALRAVPNEVADWLALRIGQAATGHPPPDDLLCLLQGGGSNGKTTLTGAIHTALGDHAVVVPERLLLSNPGDHPTELMTLRGARFALIEETPEARHLSVKRLKDTVGTPVMTARLIRHDNVTWKATHSLFITTNYPPRIDETDHGTWRRLAMVRFRCTYGTAAEVAAGKADHLGDPGLRERLRDGLHLQAVLAWVVDGAQRWYAADRVMPAQPEVVAADTMAWRAESDLICGFIADHVAFDPSAHVMSAELFHTFGGWIAARGHRPWSDQTFTLRFGGHGIVQAEGVEKRRQTRRSGLSQTDPWVAAPSQYTAWLGVRFRTSGDEACDEDDEDEDEADLRKRGPLQGLQGLFGEPIVNPLTQRNQTTPASPARRGLCTVCHRSLNASVAAAGETVHATC